jgi:hypothetical protein
MSLRDYNGKSANEVPIWILTEQEALDMAKNANPHHCPQDPWPDPVEQVEAVIGSTPIHGTFNCKVYQKNRSWFCRTCFKKHSSVVMWWHQSEESAGSINNRTISVKWIEASDKVRECQ